MFQYTNSSEMRRYSEIPNTPTPFSKSNPNELKIGSVLTIPNTGRAVLKYVGPVQGKNGTFAGVELLGESAALGKNSGDVNGIEYFRTKTPGSGLFMTYEKLMGLVDYVESPPLKRLSLMNSPTNVFGTTPARSRLSLTPGHLAHTRSISKRSSIARSHSGTPPPLPQQSQKKVSPSYEELNRLSTAKTLVENEKSNLIHETDSLKYEIEELKSRLEHHEHVIRELEKSHNQDVLKIQNSEERTSDMQKKLLKQKASHEEQRDELLDVIDQLEAQVNDNEKLYLGELQRLQIEIKEKEELLQSLQSGDNKKSLEDNSRLLDLENQFEKLKLEKDDCDKIIEELRSKTKETEDKLANLNKESLELKETAISDQKAYEAELNDAQDKISKLEEEHAVKDRVIEKLREEIKLLKAESKDDGSILKLQTEVQDLKDQLQKTETEALEVSKLQDQIKSLESQAQLNSNTDRVNELEFKLENKERIIKDLQDQISTSRDVSIEGSDSKADSHQLRMLQEELIKKDNIIKDNETMLRVLDAVKREAETLREEITNKQQKLEDKEAEIKSLKISDDSKKSIEEKLTAKEKELSSLRQTLSDLQKQLKELKLVDQKKSVIETERADLNEKLRQKQAELDSLSKKLEEVSSTAKIQSVNENHESILEEKDIEIELLKEELLQLKSSSNQTSEFKNLKKELNDLKKLNLLTTNNELNKQIELLQAELKARPSASEFQELRSELELIDELRKVEAKDKDKEIEKLQILLTESTKRLNESNKKITDSAKKEKFKPSQIYSDNEQKDVNRSTMSNLSLNRPPVISQVVDGALQIYVPDAKDPANGRKLWCGLCEREGHDSIDCPYENDIF